MKTIVIYKTKYGSTKTYAEWIAKRLSCECVSAKDIDVDKMRSYDVIIYGGGLYAEIINGVTLITKNIHALQDKKIIIYTTGLTPLSCREYYDKMVIEKNFKGNLPKNVTLFNFLGKMKLSELSMPHKLALKSLKKLMSAKEKPTDMEKLLIELCDADGDFCDENSIEELVRFAKEN